MNKKRSNKIIYFRADGNSKIGIGHLVRSVALANMLKQSFECVFLVRETHKSILDTITSNEFELKILKEEQDYLTEAKELNEVLEKNQIVLFDGYYFNDEYFQFFKKNGHKLALIDDFGEKFQLIDLIINHALSASEKMYVLKNKKYTLCLGAKYALLRKSFLEQAKKTKRLNSIKNVFICFGGADTYNLTLKVIQSLNKLKHHLHLQIVLASTHPFKSEIYNYMDQVTHPYFIHEGLNEGQMANTMSSCDIAFAPTSGIAYEICACKLAFVGGYYIDNQKGIHDGFLEEGCLLSLGDLTKLRDQDIIAATERLINNIDLANQLIKNQSKIIDGKSDKYLTSEFENLYEGSNFS